MNKIWKLFQKNQKQEEVQTEEVKHTNDFVEEEKTEPATMQNEVIVTKEIVQTEYKSFLTLFQQTSKRYYIILYLTLAKEASKTFKDRIKVLQDATKELFLTEVYLSKAMDRIEYELLPPKELMEEIFQSMHKTKQMIALLQEEMTEFERLYYRDIKIATMSTLIEKSYMEVQTAYKDQQTLLKDFKTLQEAAEYIYFHSGELIYQTLESLITCIQQSKQFKSKTPINMQYFLPSDVILTLTLPEWLNLFSKIRYILRQSAELHPLSYAQFKLLYRQLETRFLILMLYMEKTKADDFSSIRKFNI